jgi:hypothetical protein
LKAVIVALLQIQALNREVLRFDRTQQTRPPPIYATGGILNGPLIAVKHFLLKYAKLNLMIAFMPAVRQYDGETFGLFLQSTLKQQLRGPSKMRTISHRCNLVKYFSSDKVLIQSRLDRCRYR